MRNKIKVKDEDRQIPKSVSFVPAILKRLENVKGYMSRSAYVNNALEEAITRDEKRLGIK